MWEGDGERDGVGAWYRYIFNKYFSKILLCGPYFKEEEMKYNTE